MPQNLPPFADAENVLQTLLGDVGAPVVKATPEDLNPPLVVVRLLGGHSDYVSAHSEIQVSCFGTTRQQAVDLALQVQAVVENAFNSTVVLPTTNQRVVIDGTSVVTGAHPEVYENTNVREIPAVYYLTMRRPRTYAA